MKLKYLLIILLVLILGAAGAYWYFFTMTGSGGGVATDEPTGSNSGGFVPLPRPSNGASNTGVSTPTGTSTPATSTQPVVVVKLPVLRQLSDTPVGGYGASTTRSSSLVRWIDRGRGNVYEAKLDSLTVDTLSNTIVPMVAESLWNKNLTGFIGTLLADTASGSSVVYAELQSGMATGSTPYALKGKNFPDNVITYAVSPKKDKLFLILKEQDMGVGYTASFNGGTLTKILTTPLTQVAVEWPEDNTITITTAASANQNGYMYFVNPKTGAMKRVLGPLLGLTTTTSHDAKYILASYVNGQGTLQTSIYNVAKASLTEAGFLTLAEKCAWGNAYKDVVYCGVPPKIGPAVYPDDWHLGTVSFVDKIWQASATSGQIKLVSDLAKESSELIDAYTLTLDPRDDFLFFMNKDDLTLWSLDLVSS